jgi:beta-alanine degradation protein BauB
MGGGAMSNRFRERGEAMARDQHSRVGTRVLLETDEIRVWEMVLEPGESSGLHRHVNDYVFVYTTDDNVLEVRVPGAPPAQVRTEAGYVSYTRVGDANASRLTHELVNVGDARHRQILVELLGTAGEGPAVSVTNGRGTDAWAEDGADVAPT